MEKIHGLVAIFKKSLFVLFNATAESVNCSLFLKNLEKHFCNWLAKKNFVKHIKNLPQRLSEKFIGENLSITDIALRNWDLSIIGIASGFFKLSIIALAQKSLPCPSLAATQNIT